MRVIFASLAAIAVATTPAIAQNNNGNSNGKSKDKPAAKAERGNDRDQSRQSRGNKSGDKKAKRGKAKRGQQTYRDRGVSSRENDFDRRQQADRDRRGPSARDSNRETRRADRRFDDRDDRRGNRDVRQNEREARNYRDATYQRLRVRDRYIIDGCPPGLAKKNNGCLPPGLAKKSRRSLSRSYRPDLFGLGSLGSGRYFYDDGYLLRIDRNNSVGGFIPLLGGALSIGNIWPDYYESSPVPRYYSDYYDLGPANGYRYSNNVLYRVDPETTAITSVAALLTGDDFLIGEQLPAGYDVYNVPNNYREQYYDRPDANYRYSNGYVYEVDPQTNLIAAAIELLV